MNKTFTSILTTFIALSAFIPGAFAFNNVKIDLRDSGQNANSNQLQVDAEPGQLIETTIHLENTGGQTSNIFLYPIDGTVNQSGSIILKNLDQEQQNIGKWTTLSQQNLILEPESRRPIDLSIQLPESINPGTYLGGLVMENQDQCVEDCDQGISIKTRKGKKIIINIDGDRHEDIRVTDSQIINTPSGKLLQLTLQNKGNLAYQPQANIILFDSFDQQIDNISASLGTILGESNITTTVPLNLQDQYGLITAKIRVDFNQLTFGGQLKAAPNYQDLQATIFIFPWLYFFIGILPFLLIIIYLVYNHTRLIYYLNNSEPYTVSDNETLEDIAQQQKYPWQLIAKLNGLKPPYIVRKGQEIKIPKTKSK